MRKRFSTIILIITVTLLGKFWIGIYEHDEFKQEDIFFKHRAIWKTYFYSPRGMSDLKLSQMTPDKQIEQKLFDEFIIEHHFSK
nr:hypothetical protein [uncultured Psychroserpens sp.]